MQLVVNTFGASLRKEGNLFHISVKDHSFKVSAEKVQTILVTTGAHFSTDAVQLAVEHNIDITFLNKFGQPYARIWHATLGSTNLIRRRLLEVSQNEIGTKFAKEWACRKLKNQCDHLRELAKTRPGKREYLGNAVGHLEHIGKQIQKLKGTIFLVRGSLMGLEGSAGRVYFDALASVMPDRFRFHGRSARPAKDLFNCFLNYAYGVLYALTERACMIAGLDPFIGIVHTDNYNKVSLVFDIVELFRVYAEKVVVKLIAGRKAKLQHCDIDDAGGHTLNREGKAVLIESLNTYLDEVVRYGQRNLKRRDTIQYECHHIAQQLIRPKGGSKVNIDVFDVAKECGEC